jgi:hypothetical protein
MLDLTRTASTGFADCHTVLKQTGSSGRHSLVGFVSSAWLIALLIACLLLYLPALWGVFVFDDYPWILHNTGLDISAFDFWQRRPVTLLTFAANLYVAGPNPAAFHVVNIALHLANGVLVYMLIGRMVPRSMTFPAIAALGVAVFLLHPAQAGAVTYISGRATALMTFWLLIGHLAALRQLENQSGWRWGMISLCAFMLAVGSKETALVYPAMLTAWLFFGKGLPAGRSLRLAAPHVLLAALLLGGMLLHPGYRTLLAEAADAGQLAVTPAGQVEQRLGMGFCFNDNKPRQDSCLARRVESIAGLTRFLFLPWTISIDPGRRAVSGADLLTVALVVVAAWVALGLRPEAVAAGTAWLIAALLPTSILLVRSDPVTDRLLYLPMVGIALVIAAVAGRPGGMSIAPVARVCACLVLSGLALATWQRNLQFQSEMALWHDAVTKNASNPRARVNLAYTYEMNGEFDRAGSEYRVALDLQPGLRWAEQGLWRIQFKREGGKLP